MNIQEFHFVPDEYISQITDNIFLGSSLCLNDAAIESQQILRDAGVTALISLRRTREETPDFIYNLLWLPTVDDTPISKLSAHVAADFIERHVEFDKKVYIHCKLGHGRAPTTLASYFVLKKGFTPEEAVKFIQERRPEIHILPSQMELLNSLFEDLTSKNS